MRVLPALFPALILWLMGSASAEPVLFHPGTGVPNPGQGDSRAMWSEPPDLNGFLGSSEQILAFGYETEIANDFSPTETVITHATWWGGYYNNSIPCDPGIPTLGFNLRFYNDRNCYAPCPPVVDLSITQFEEESVGCQAGLYPLFRWKTNLQVQVVAGIRYWFGAQLEDHPFPPQFGRLASMAVVGCDSEFWTGMYFEPPCTWYPCNDVFGVPYDASQEFDGDHSEACCFPDGHCEVILTGACTASGGTAHGPGPDCDPNPCTATAAQPASWGKIKSLFR